MLFSPGRKRTLGALLAVIVGSLSDRRSRSFHANKVTSLRLDRLEDQRLTRKIRHDNINKEVHSSRIECSTYSTII